METQFERKPVEFEGETYLVPTHFFGENNAKHKLYFSPGFCLPTIIIKNFYKSLIDSMKNDDGLQIISSGIIGKK